VTTIEGGITVRWRDIARGGRITIVDLLGQEITAIELAGGSGETRIDLSSAASGLYLWQSGEDRGKIVSR
jgi:hypothetical protein